MTATLSSLEDGLDERRDGWSKLTMRGERVQLSATISLSPTHAVAAGHHAGADNAILVKLTKVGTLTRPCRSAHGAGHRFPWSFSSFGETGTTMPTCVGTGADR